MEKPEFRKPKTWAPVSRRSAIDPQWLVIEALTFFAAQADEGQRFFAWSGLDAASLRSAAAAPEFLAGLLDYFAQNLISLERLCQTAGLDPGAVIDLHESTRQRGLTSHDDV